VRHNGEDGIDLNAADDNQVLHNVVEDNGDVPDESGIELSHADRNRVDGNTIRNNADGLTDVIRCLSGGHNTGSNVTPACR